MLEEKLALKNLYEESDFRANMIRIAKIRRSDCVLFLCNSKETQLENYLKETGASVKQVHTLFELKGQENQTFDVLFYFQGKTNDDFFSEGLEFFLEELERVGKEDGRILLATENPHGVKHLVSDDMAPVTSDCFSYDSWLEVLSVSFPFKQVNCYYPYPDHYYPISFFSDKHLPKQDELDRDIYDEEMDRVELCKENALLKHLTQQGLFPKFNNSFLFWIDKKESPETPVYIKFSNERARNFQIATRLYHNRVVKEAIHPEGKAHILNMIEMEKRLSTVYDGSLLVNHCFPTEDEGCLEFEFVRGETLQKKLEQAALQGETEKFLSLVDTYVSKCFPKEKMTSYSYSPLMTEVFGISEDASFEAADCLPVSSIDMIFENIVIQNDNWTLLDYEWCFEFFIPYQFILYRTLFYFYQKNPQLMEEVDLYRRYGISEAMKEVFFSMELQFQKYICKDRIPLRDELRLAGGCNYIPMEQRFFIRANEDTSMELGVRCWEENKKISLDFPCDVLKLEIFSPGQNLEMSIASLKLEDEEISLAEIQKNNGHLIWIDETTFLLLENERISIPVVAGKQIKKIQMIVSSVVLPEDFACKLKKKITDLSLTVNYFEERIQHIENKALYKLYKKIKK